MGKEDAAGLWLNRTRDYSTFVSRSMIKKYGILNDWNTKLCGGEFEFTQAVSLRPIADSTSIFVDHFFHFRRSPLYSVSTRHR
jgi:hypothetical protein